MMLGGYLVDEPAEFLSGVGLIVSTTGVALARYRRRERATVPPTG
jgi:hypothetical protein